MILIKNIHIYAPEDQGRKDILICNDKIIAIGENLEYNFEDMQILDGANLTCVPGLIDQHVHVTGGGGESSFSSRVPELNLSHVIECGVTTVLGLLGTDSRTRSVENLVAKTKGLNQEGITAYCLTGAYEYPAPNLTGSVGNDIAYINEVVGVKLAISDHRCSNPTVEELIRLASEVRISGLLGGKAGIVHMHTGAGKIGLKNVIAAIENSDIPIFHFRPTHIRSNTPYAYEFAQMGGRLDFTSGNTPEATADLIVEYLKKVPAEQITFSSDSNGSQPVWNDKNELIGITAAKMTSLYETTKVLVQKHKLPLEQAICFTTKNVADGLNLAHKGRIAVGCDADLLFIDDKLEIHSVIARGKIMMQAGKVLVKGTFEE